MKFCSLISCLILALLLASCAAPHISSEPLIRSTPFEARQWLARLPEGEYAIGISYADPYGRDSSQALAKDFAAVGMSRNHASYIVDKEIILDLANAREVDLNRINFNVVVSADLDFLHRSARDLKLVDSFSSSGYLIGLYSLNQESWSSSETVIMNGDQPDWGKREGISLSGDVLYSVASSHQAELGDALNLAQEIALRQIAQYRLQNVLAKIRSIDDRVDQALALETVTRSQNCSFNRLHIRQFKSDESLSYEVIVQMKSYK